MRFSAVTLALVLAAATGCQNKNQQKIEAQQRWNNTRAAILLGVAGLNVGAAALLLRRRVRGWYPW